MNLSSIHPFPARMAPELARQPLAAVPIGGRVLDPMCGSGDGCPGGGGGRTALRGCGYRSAGGGHVEGVDDTN